MLGRGVRSIGWHHGGAPLTNGVPSHQRSLLINFATGNCIHYLKHLAFSFLNPNIALMLHKVEHGARWGALYSPNTQSLFSLSITHFPLHHGTLHGSPMLLEQVLLPLVVLLGLLTFRFIFIYALVLHSIDNLKLRTVKSCASVFRNSVS